MGGDFYTPYTFTRTPYTFTITLVLLKMQKTPIFRVLLGIKKTEIPIFQGISVVLPKLYLGGGRDRSQNIDSTH